MLARRRKSRTGIRAGIRNPEGIPGPHTQFSRFFLFRPGFRGAEETADDLFQALEKPLAAQRTAWALVTPQPTDGLLVRVGRQVPPPTRHKLQQRADADQPAV
jgi:hypothetical protein